MRPDHPVLNTPLSVPHQNGRLKVLRRVASDQSGMGEALTLDGIVNSIDAELIAKGLSAKGAERGAIVRHGRYTLWAFEADVDDMTDAGRALFVNTAFYAAAQANSPVLEKMRGRTRDGLFLYLAKARSELPGLLRTLYQYLPPDAQGKSLAETTRWVTENRPYLRREGRQFVIDTLAKRAGIPNYRRALLEYCIANLQKNEQVQESAAALARYTGRDDLGTSPQKWQTWYDENKDYLFFSDNDGSQFKIDAEAKAQGIPTAKLRGWSSEDIDYRADPDCAKLKPGDSDWLVKQVTAFRNEQDSARANALLDAVQLIVTFTDYTTTDAKIETVYRDLAPKAGKPGAMLALLDDADSIRRIMAATLLDYQYGPMQDLAYDALDQAPSVRTRAEELIKSKKQ